MLRLIEASLVVKGGFSVTACRSGENGHAMGGATAASPDHHGSNDARVSTAWRLLRLDAAVGRFTRGAGHHAHRERAINSPRSKPRKAERPGPPHETFSVLEPTARRGPSRLVAPHAVTFHERPTRSLHHGRCVRLGNRPATLILLRAGAFAPAAQTARFRLRLRLRHCVPSILSGRWPVEHRNWCYFVYDPARSPFRMLRHLRWLPTWLTGRRIVRRLLTKCAQRRRLGLSRLLRSLQHPLPSHFALRFHQGEEKSAPARRHERRGKHLRFPHRKPRPVFRHGHHAERGVEPRRPHRRSGSGTDRLRFPILGRARWLAPSRGQ